MSSLALAGGLVGIGIALLSCDAWKANDAFNALQITQVSTISGEGATCSVAASGVTTTRTMGTLDVYLPDNSYPPYLLPLVVVNNLDSAGGSKATEMNNMTLTHFSITLSAPGMSWPSSCPATFDSEHFTIPLAPGGSTGYAVSILESQHSRCLLAALAPQASDLEPRHVLVSASIVAKGRHGGTTIESAPFVYNVDVCTGCLQDAYTSSALAVYLYPAGFPACDALVGTNPYPGDPCLPPGQDAPILCCGLTDASGHKRGICPAIPTGTATATSTDTSTATGP
jgi:hypothetical protein